MGPIHILKRKRQRLHLKQIGAGLQLIVQVRSKGIAGIPKMTDDLPLLHMLSGPHRDGTLPHVHHHAEFVVAVIDNDAVARYRLHRVVL